MFDFVRKHTKVMQFVLFLLIVPSFVLFGLQGYNRMQERGASISETEVETLLDYLLKTFGQE